MKKLVIITIAMCFGLFAQAQTAEKIAFNRGVNAYQKGEYAKAMDSFKKAFDLNNDYLKALYNAGNAAYLNGDFEDAKQLFADYTRFADSRIDKAKAHYNIGNIALQNGKSIEKELLQVIKDQTVSFEDKMKLFDTSQDEYKSAIKSYKESLRNNSSDADVKYNLTYALKHLKHLEQQQKQQQQQQKEDSDKDKDKQEGDQDKKDKGDQGEDQKEGDQGDESDQKGETQKDSDSDKDGDPTDKDGGKEKDKKEQEGKEKENGKEKEQEDSNDPKEEQNGEQKGKEEEKEIEGQISKAQAGKELDAMNNDEQKVLMKVFRSKEEKKKQINSKKDW